MQVFYPSLEMRWFFEGRLPSEAESWFTAAERAGAERASRTDHYLFLPGLDAVGAKLREGRIEIKQRLGPPELVSLPGPARGCVERWRKWSFGLGAGEDSFDPGRYPASAWLPVRKERLLCTYVEKTGRGLAVQAPDEPEPGQGCGLELTRVEAAGEIWWSLGFEAFGPEHALPDVLNAATHHVLADPPPVPLTAGASFGYPHWMARLPAEDPAAAFAVPAFGKRHELPPG